MSATHYYFIPSLRQGLATYIKEPVAGNAHRVELSAELEVKKYPIGGLTATEMIPTEWIPKPLQIYGPGDILTFDQRIVARTYPERDVGDFEPNYFPSIEFSDADFLWRFTATVADKEHIGKKLTPWVTLVVLVAEPLGDNVQPEFEEVKSTDSNLPPYIKVRLPDANTGTDPFPLPDLDHAWRWAHVQITDEAGLNDAVLDSILKNEPERAICRLLCPRRLQPKVKYGVFVVPTFRLGVRAGLGLDLPDDVGALDPAWNADGSDPDNDYFHAEAGVNYLRLPYYYNWEFRAGMRGDFEHLVRLLEPRKLTDLGKRDIDCSAPGFDIPAVEREEYPEPERHYLEMEGALRSLDTHYTCWGRDLCLNIKKTEQITDLEVSQLNHHSIEIRWRTTLPVSSRVDYGETVSYGNQVDDAVYVEQHILSISGLVAGTPYHIKISGEDGDGNVVETQDGIIKIPPTDFQEKLADLINMPDAERSESSLNVRETETIQRITVKRVVSESALEIAFYTVDATTAHIDYGETQAYGQTVTEPAGEFINEHRLHINDPVPGLTYHFRITTETQDGTIKETEDGTFVIRQFMIDETDAINEISVKVEQSSDEAMISWRTTKASKSRVDIWQLDQAPIIVESPDSICRNEHSLKLENLLPGHLYYFKIVAQADDGTTDETPDGVFFVPRLPVVVPPIYGRWHASQGIVNADNQKPWLEQMNLDPRHRAAAGLGAEVIRKQQEALMSSAWDQLGAIESVNDLLRRAQLGRESTSAMHRRMDNLDNEGFLQATASVQKRILVEDTASGNNVTAKHFISSQTRIPNAALDPAFRRIGRLRGPIRKRQRQRPGRNLYDRLADGQIVPAAKAETLIPAGTQGICNISKNIKSSVTPLIKFSAAPVFINNELHAELKWQVENVTTCIASSSDVSINQWRGNKPLIGELTVGPLGAATVFNLECGNDVYRTTRSVVLKITPQVNMRSFTYVVSDEFQPHLEWISRYASNREARLGWSGSQPAAGLKKVNPESNPTEYKLFCEGAGGIAHQNIWGAALSYIGFSSDPPSGPSGHRLYLQWKSVFATSCTTSGDWVGNKDGQGSEIIEPLTTKTYEVACNGETQGIKASTTVSTAPILKFKAKKQLNFVNLFMLPERTQLNRFKLEWEANTNKCQLSGPGGWNVELGAEGEELVSITDQSNTLTLECENDHGHVSQTLTINKDTWPLVNLPSVELVVSAFIAPVNQGCVDFRNASISSGPNPRWEIGASFLVHDYQLVPVDNTRIREWSRGKKGLDALRRTIIELSACKEVQIVVAIANPAGCSATAYDKDGNIVANASTSKDQSVSHTLILTGTAIERVVLDCPQEEVLIEQFCHDSAFLGYYALLSWNIRNAGEEYAPTGAWSHYALNDTEGHTIIGPLPSVPETTFGLTAIGPYNLLNQLDPRNSATIDVTIKLPPYVGLLAKPESDNKLLLEWDSACSDWREALDDWSGKKSVHAAQNVGPINDTALFGLKAASGVCQQLLTGEVCIIQRSMIRSVAANVSPGLRFAASTYVIDDDTYVKLIWVAVNAQYCKVSWATPPDRPTSGKETIGPITIPTTFTITCESIGGSASREITVDPIQVQELDSVSGIDVGGAAFCEDNVSGQSAQDQLGKNPFDRVKDPSAIPDTKDMVKAAGEVIDNWLNQQDEEEEEPPIRDRTFLNDLRTNIHEALRPGRTLVDRTRQRLQLSEAIAQRFEAEARGDPLDPVMWAPEFSQPMYEPLRDISHDLLLPGVEKIPQNTLGLLKTNRRFVESYLCGLNHELAGELLWREYPTDQRGSYFRQFWDVSERIGSDEVPEELKDVRLLHRWNRNQLGNNTAEGAAVTDSAVLVVRGDLLKRYPRAVIYAIDAVPSDGNGGDEVPGLKEYLKCYQKDGDGNIIRDNEEKPLIDEALVEQTLIGIRRIFPIFRVTLPTDMTFFGFPFDPVDARTKFFIIEERVGEVRFGLDTSTDVPLNHWNDLAWWHFGLHESYGAYLDAGTLNNQPGTTEDKEWTNNSSSATRAWITMQKPVRVAIHGSQMIPDDG